MGDYTEPQWREANALYAIEAIKDGVLTDVYELVGKSHFTIGRSEINDIQMLHSSISRVHSVFQQGKNHLYIYDLGSTHGSFLNKKQVPAFQYERVYNGDLLEFGKSSRTYFVNGPEDEVRPQAVAVFDKSGKLNPSLTKDKRLKDMIESVHTDAALGEIRRTKIQAALQEVTWGVDEDAQEDVIRPGDEILFAEKLDLEAIRARPEIKSAHVKLIKQIEQKRSKLESLRKELQNLGRKEGEDNLSDGQLLRKHKLTEQLDEKTQELESSEEQLRSMLLESDEPKIQKRPKEDSDMEDEFFDRTLRRELQPANSCESLQERLDRLSKEQADIVDELTNCNGNELEEEEDSLESFMKDVTHKLQAENMETLRQRLTEVNSQIESIQVTAPFLKPSGPVVKDQSVDPLPPVPTTRSFKVYTATSKPIPRNDTSDLTVSKEDLEVIYGDNDVEPMQLQAAKNMIDEVWEPPAEQQGDGKTELNKKYGY